MKGLHDAGKAGSRGAGRRGKWAVQAGAFVFFLGLFLLMCHPIRSGVPYRILFDLDPFTFLAGWTAGTRTSWVPPALFLLLGVLAGRLFCGYVCPLGFCIDLADRFLGATGVRGRNAVRTVADARCANPAAPGPGAGRKQGPEGLQWIVLGLVLVGALLHNSLPLVLDPINLLFRGLAVVVYPAGTWMANGLIGLARPMAEWMGWYRLAYLSLEQPAFRWAMGSFFLLTLVLVLGFHSSRFWCRTVCPLGALLGLLARFAPVKRSVAETCTTCGRCGPACPMGAIGEDPRRTKRSACIQCRSCRDLCPADAVSFPLSSARRELAAPLPEGVSRRRLFGGIATGGMFLVLTRLDPRVMKKTDRWLRPPGAIPEEDFLAACIRCGACLRVCVTHTLQASGLENGWIRWCTPVPDLRFAGCEQQCNLCGTVCPTGAIRSLPLVERQHAKMGTAILTRDRCVAWARDRLCLLCDEACPYNAVVFEQVEGHKRPFVDAGRCNGCGMCEAVCPVEGEAAIAVFPEGEVRLQKGSYRDVLNRQRILLVPKQDHPGLPPGGKLLPLTEEEGKTHG